MLQLGGAQPSTHEEQSGGAKFLFLHRLQSGSSNPFVQPLQFGG